MVSEFFSVGGSNLAIKLTPGENGVLTVVVDGEKIFDKQTEGSHPDLNRIKELTAIVKDKVSSITAAD